MEPSSPEEWVEVAKERSRDARILSDGRRSLGAVYMAGYSVECYLKAYLQKNGISQPPRGKEAIICEDYGPPLAFVYLLLATLVETGRTFSIVGTLAYDTRPPLNLVFL